MIMDQNGVKMDSTVAGNFNLLRENPEELLLLLDKHVRVQLIKSNSFVGFVHSIDPISYSVLLSVPILESYKTILLPGHAILDITEINPITNTKPPIRISATLESAQEIALSKAKIIGWLKENMLPLSEDGDKIVFGNASLLPPYGLTDIYTDNPIVVMQVRKILEAMPHDFVPK